MPELGKEGGRNFGRENLGCPGFSLSPPLSCWAQGFVPAVELHTSHWLAPAANGRQLLRRGAKRRNQAGFPLPKLEEAVYFELGLGEMLWNLSQPYLQISWVEPTPFALQAAHPQLNKHHHVPSHGLARIPLESSFGFAVSALRSPRLPQAEFGELQPASRDHVASHGAGGYPHSHRRCVLYPK